ncbi:hypothetical protein CGMCC3_g1417 [Colletotrichum fructicola]|nr:uncharacterized protein CGMCC3_g1417 [Colletotrichum fructicola]KAE9582264.1 hypothetical protein CGMCC3_g1417 [Colletotrichum fructicola]
MNQPIIAVNINYRLGIAGFLSSEELTAAGIPSNRGLLDMIVALGWLKTFISGFGGDPDNITAVGQSAGAASLCYLLGHEEPLFRQAVLLGGTFLMMRPRSTRQAEVLYGEIIDTLGLTSMSPNERLKALLSMPSDKLVPMTPDVVRLGPVIDNSVILQKPTFSNLGNNELILPGKTWCQKIYLVQSEFDGSIFDQVNLGLRPPGVGDAFRQHLEDSFGVKRAAIVIETYKLMGNIPDSLAVENITNLITDIMFLAPAIALSEAWVGRAVLGLFNEHNPWNGPYKGKANHLLDVALLWGNFNGVYEQKPWTVARALAESFVSFVNNKVDLPLFDQQERVTVFGPSDEDVSSTIVGLKDEKAKRSRDIFKLAANVGGLDALLDSVQSFLSS